MSFRDCQQLFFNFFRRAAPEYYCGSAARYFKFSKCLVSFDNTIITRYHYNVKHFLITS